MQIYGTAVHRKCLIDVMSSFGVKSILKIHYTWLKKIVGLDVWFANSQEMWQYLDLRKDPILSYSIIDQAAVNKKRMQKTARKCWWSFIRQNPERGYTLFICANGLQWAKYVCLLENKFYSGLKRRNIACNRKSQCKGRYISFYGRQNVDAHTSVMVWKPFWMRYLKLK